MAKKEKKGKGEGREKALQQIAQTGDGGHVYRELGDRDASDVIDIPSVTWRGSGYSQAVNSLADWVSAIQGSDEAENGDYIMYRKNIYQITGADTAVKVQI